MQNTAAFFSALAEPTRLRLLCLMRDGDVCVCHLQRVLQTNQPKISRHLAYLKSAGLVRSRRQGKWMYYSLAGIRGPLKRVLSETIAHTRTKPQARKDARRLKGMRCS
jgi:ArsR family transcriptional regulator